jgi:uncharacterized protein YukE
LEVVRGVSAWACYNSGNVSGALDPTALIESLAGDAMASLGDPDGIRQGARQFAAAAGALEGHAHRLNAIATEADVAWQGRAASAFADAGGTVALQLRQAAGRYREAAAVLNSYAAVVEHARDLRTASTGRLAALNPLAGDDLQHALRQVELDIGTAGDLVRCAARSAAEELHRLASALSEDHRSRIPAPPALPAPNRDWPPAELWIRQLSLESPLGFRLDASSEAGQVRAPRGSGGGQLSPAAAAALMAVLAALLAGKSLNDPEVQKQLADFQRARNQRAVAAANAPNPLGSPKKPELDEETKAKVRRAAEDLGVDPQYMESLARDPAKGWIVTDNTIEEARLAVRLEQEGRLQEPVRDPTGGAEFIEDKGAGQGWDVKSFRRDNFNLTGSLDRVQGELELGQNVIVDTAHLAPDQVTELWRAILDRGWSGRVIFASS